MPRAGGRCDQARLLIALRPAAARHAGCPYGLKSPCTQPTGPPCTQPTGPPCRAADRSAVRGAGRRAGLPRRRSFRHRRRRPHGGAGRDLAGDGGGRADRRAAAGGVYGVILLAVAKPNGVSTGTVDLAAGDRGPLCRGTVGVSRAGRHRCPAPAQEHARADGRRRVEHGRRHCGDRRERRDLPRPHGRGRQSDSSPSRSRRGRGGCRRGRRCGTGGRGRPTVRSRQMIKNVEKE